MPYLLRRLPSVFFICWSALNFAQLRTWSTIGDFWTKSDDMSIYTQHTLSCEQIPFFMNSSERVGFVPNLLAGKVNVSFV